MTEQISMTRAREILAEKKGGVATQYNNQCVLNSGLFDVIEKPDASVRNSSWKLKLLTH